MHVEQENTVLERTEGVALRGAESGDAVGGEAAIEIRPPGPPGLSAERRRARVTPGLLRGVVWALKTSVYILLNLVVSKPISMFVWWLHAGANRTTFHGRTELARRVKRARRSGRPVLFVSNHLSMFDDPVIPMALFRTGSRAAAEVSCLGMLLVLWLISAPSSIRAGALAASIVVYSVGIAVFGARKTWWSIGDLVNFSGVSALRGKMEFGRERPLSVVVRMLLAIADPVIFVFMRSPTVKTVLVDRRPGEAGRQSRARAVARGIELAVRGEQVWVFFEGGRSRNPDEIQPARGGIGQVIRGCQDQGVRPVVIAIHHRGLECIIPMSSRRWFTTGNRFDVRWSEFYPQGDGSQGVTVRDPETIADDIRAAVLRLQSAWRSERSTDA